MTWWLVSYWGVTVACIVYVLVEEHRRTKEVEQPRRERQRQYRRLQDPDYRDALAELEREFPGAGR